MSNDKQRTVAADPAPAQELTEAELNAVTGGMDPLHLLAQVNHLASQDASPPAPPKPAPRPRPR